MTGPNKKCFLGKPLRDDPFRDLPSLRSNSVRHPWRVGPQHEVSIPFRELRVLRRACRVVSCPQATPGSTGFLTVLQYLDTAAMCGSLPVHTNSPQPPPSSATFNPHRPASAANARGFLLTALSNARTKHSFPCNYAECARPIKH